MKMQKRHWSIPFLVAVGVICFFGICNLLALEVPALKARVNDTAGMLSPTTRQQLEDVLARLEETDSTQIVVLTIPSLEGEVLEEFSIKVLDQWKIGQRGLDNGAMLLIARNDRKIRIEVGYGLEGSLTDLMAGRIIRNVIVPQFKAGQFDQGVINAVQAMIKVVRGEYKASDKLPNGGGQRPNGMSGGLAGLIAFLFFISLLGRLRRALGIAAGGILAPIAASLFFNVSSAWLLLSIPIGLLIGLILSFLGSPLIFGHGHHHHRHTGGWWSGGGGGFSTGGFGGGGGGFGGGGASGGW
ncbi:MAG: TPM domain-containing protein [Desulfobacterales bacterium]|nr:TPM domain-containing protein [Desulfobacterales bacterium]